MIFKYLSLARLDNSNLDRAPMALSPRRGCVEIFVYHPSECNKHVCEAAIETRAFQLPALTLSLREDQFALSRVSLHSRDEVPRLFGEPVTFPSNKALKCHSFSNSPGNLKMTQCLILE